MPFQFDDVQQVSAMTSIAQAKQSCHRSTMPNSSINCSTPCNRSLKDHAISKIEDNLYLGQYNATLNYGLLKEHGITHIVNVTYDNDKQPLHASYDYLHFKASDNLMERFGSHLRTIVDYISEAIANGGKVFVHCVVGKSRSATVVIAYLMTKRKIFLKQAFDFVRQRRCIVRPNTAFCHELRRLEARLVGTDPKSFKGLHHDDDPNRPHQEYTWRFAMNHIFQEARENEPIRHYSAIYQPLWHFFKANLIVNCGGTRWPQDISAGLWPICRVMAVGFEQVLAEEHWKKSSLKNRVSVLQSVFIYGFHFAGCESRRELLDTVNEILDKRVSQYQGGKNDSEQRKEAVAMFRSTWEEFANFLCNSYVLIQDRPGFNHNMPERGRLTIWAAGQPKGRVVDAPASAEEEDA